MLGMVLHLLLLLLLLQVVVVLRLLMRLLYGLIGFWVVDGLSVGLRVVEQALQAWVVASDRGDGLGGLPLR